MAVPRSAHARLFYRAAKERYNDALLLFELQRTTAAVYLAGYSVECILKSLILSATPAARQQEVLETFRGGRAHDYDWLSGLYADRAGSRIPTTITPHFSRVNTWSTDMRYAPGTVMTREAKTFLDSVTAILEWAEGRLS